MSPTKGHSNLTKANSILLERVNALENKVRKIDEEQRDDTNLHIHLEERIADLQLTTQILKRTLDTALNTVDEQELKINSLKTQKDELIDVINNQVDQITERLNTLEDKQDKISETVLENYSELVLYKAQIEEDISELTDKYKYEIADLQKFQKVLANRMRG